MNDLLDRHTTCRICTPNYYLYFFATTENHKNKDCPYQYKLLHNGEEIEMIMKSPKKISIICEYQNSIIKIEAGIHNDLTFENFTYFLPTRIAKIMNNPDT